MDVIAQSYQRDNIRELALELGLAPALNYKWRAAYGNDGLKAFPAKPSRINDCGRLSGRHGRPRAGLGQVWASDITYLPSSQSWLYLTRVMDLPDWQFLVGISARASSPENVYSGLPTSRSERRPDRLPSLATVIFIEDN